MKKFLLSLMLVTPLVCETVYGRPFPSISRCENEEVICYLYAGYALQCKFK